MDSRGSGIYASTMPRSTIRPEDEPGDDSSFARGLRVLLAVASRPGVRADELAAGLGAPVSTVYRYLRTLGEAGFVERRGGVYHLGPRIVIGDDANVTSALLVAAAGPVLASLAVRSGETALLVRRVGTSAVVLDAAEPPRPLRVVSPAGETGSLTGDPLGLVLLAFAPEPVVAETPGASRAVRAELRRIAAAGIAIGESDAPDRVVTVAVPVLRDEGIAGALGLRGPADRCDAAWRERAERLLREGAAAIVEAIR
ncbi:MAG: hypothetical protein RL338_1414 [Chloroflexota bacterium]